MGITTPTVWEALAMVDAGIDRVLVANEIIGAPEASLLASAARAAQITVAVEHTDGAVALSRAAHEHGTNLDVLIEVDVGMTRGGVRSTAEAFAVASSVSELPGITLRGVMGWEGHTATEADREKRKREANRAVGHLLDVAEELRAAGFSIDVVSAGDTNTYDITGASPGITDIQAGTYAVMDTSYESFAPAFAPALTVAGTVVSRTGGPRRARLRL